MREGQNDRLYNMNVPSLNLARAFLDFAEYLPHSEYVLDKDQTLEWLRALAEEYRHPEETSHVIQEES